MLISISKLRVISIKAHHIFLFRSTTLSSLSHVFPFTQKSSSDDALNHVLYLLKEPNWEEHRQLKSLASHMSPESACQVMSFYSKDIELCFRFFKWVCRQSTYCYSLDSRIHLLNLMMHSNLFGVLQKAIIVLIKDCSFCENDALRLIGVLDDMRRYGFRLGYPCYSTLLMSLSKLQMGLSAFSVYERMVGDGYILGLIDYRTLINALCKNGFVRAAEMFISRVLKVGFDLDVHICTSLVLGCCRVGDLKEAFQVFGIMSKRDGCGTNAVTYTVLIHGLCEAGKLEEACRLKEEMVMNGCPLSTRTYTVFIKAISDVGLTGKALTLFSEMIKKGSNPNCHTYTILIDGFCREGKIDEANGMFRKMMKDGLIPGTVTFNALINGYCKQGRVVSAFELLATMEKKKCKPNIRTFHELMEGLCRIGKPYKAMALLGKIIDNGLQPQTLTYNILVDGFCREGQLDMAFRISQSMDSLSPKSDGFTYTTLIDRLSKEGKLDQAHGLLGVMMKKGVSLDEVTFTTLMDGYCKTAKMKDAIRLLNRMVQSRYLTLTSPHIFNSLLDALSKDLKVKQENAVLGKMLRCGVPPSVVTYTILIDGFLRTGNTTRSLKVFDFMKQSNCSPNVYTYTVLIHGFCQNDRIEEAVKLLQTMSSLGVPPNVITYTVLVKAYVKAGELERAFEILHGMVKDRCQPNSETFFALLEGLVAKDSANDGSLSNIVFREMKICHADELLEKAKKYGVGASDIYNFLIMGLYKVGRTLEASDLVQEMVRHGQFPLVSVCSHITEDLCRKGKYDHCLEWMKLMFDHGFVPSFASFCSLVEGLQKEGMVREAEELISDLLNKSGVKDIEKVSKYIQFLVKVDDPSECLELLQVVEGLDHQERPII